MRFAKDARLGLPDDDEVGGVGKTEGEDEELGDDEVGGVGQTEGEDEEQEQVVEPSD